MYDLAIIGGGPAGVSAGVYASRKQLKTIFIAAEFGGQSIVSEDIQNWIGTISIKGLDLAKSLEDHLRAYAKEFVQIQKGEYVKEVTGNKGNFTITTDKGSYNAKTVLVTTGSTRRQLDIPGAKEFEHKGLTYCASCDGPLFTGQDMVVIGGGNAAFETAAQLLAYAKSVTLLNRGDALRADPVTVEKVLKHPNMTAIKNAIPTQITGDKFVKSIFYKDAQTHEEKEIIAPAIFVEIGLIPTTSFVKNITPLNKIGQIIVDPRNQKTQTPGIWAAGDCTDGMYHQNNIASGDAVKALEDIYVDLHAR